MTRNARTAKQANKNPKVEELITTTIINFILGILIVKILNLSQSYYHDCYCYRKVTAQRSPEPGFLDDEAEGSGGPDFLPSPDALAV